MKKLLSIVKHLNNSCSAILAIILLFTSCKTPTNNQYNPVIIDTAYTDLKISDSTYGTYRADYNIYYIGKPIDTIIINHLFNFQLNPLQHLDSVKKEFHRFVVKESAFSSKNNISEVDIFVDTSQRFVELYMDPINPKLLEYYPLIITNLSDSNNLYLPMFRGYGINLQVLHNHKPFYPEMGVDCGTQDYSVMIPPRMVLISGVKKYKDSIKTKARIVFRNFQSNEFELGIHPFLLKD